MDDSKKPKDELIEELNDLRRRNAVLSEAVENQKNIERTLRDTRAEMAAILENTPMIVAVMDEERRVRKVNNAVIDFTGKPERELLTMRCGEALLCLNSFDAPEGCGFGRLCGECGVWNAIKETYRTKKPQGLGEVKIPRKREGTLEDLFFLVSTSPVRLDNEDLVIVCLQNISDWKSTEEALRIDEERLEALLRLARMSEVTMEEIMEYALEEGVRLTGSKIGYLHFVDEDQNTLRLTSWSKAVLKQCTALSKPHYPLDQAGVWADCVRTLQPAVHNDYPAMPGRRGLPDGHSPIHRHMSIPVMNGSKVVAVAGVGNKERPYDQSDVRQLSLFMHSMWEILERSRYEEELHQGVKKIKKSLGGFIQSMAVVVEKRDPYTAGHQRRVTELACVVTGILGLTAHDIEGIRMAGLIHDLGKIEVPAEILSKPARLNKQEFAFIRNHPGAGFEVLKDIEFPWPLARAVLQHHERLDGSGYPGGIPGRDIIIEAKILAVADVVEAMASHRPYRPALGIDAALEEIARQRGILFDSDVVDACIEAFRKMRFNFP
jgi:HD-GYP domain-containing protein (c-di-GMP phosphodiesterase class II)